MQAVVARKKMCLLNFLNGI